MLHWVPHSQTDYHKTVWKEVCSNLLFDYKADGEYSLSCIITEDKTQICHFKLQTNSQWNGIIQLLLRRRSLRLPRSVRKVMATVFLDAERVILLDITPLGQTTNSDLYIIIIIIIIIIILGSTALYGPGPPLASSFRGY